MRNRAGRPIAAILAIFALASIPAQAAPVAIRDVIQVFNGNQNPPDIQLRSFSQYNSIYGPSGDTQKPTGSVSRSTDSLLSGVVTASDPKAVVELTEEGDVEGTICDCGEIPFVAGGFPKWPLMFLAAVPLAFIPTGDDDSTPLPKPTPPVFPTQTLNTPTPVPEPASLLLLGSGLVTLGATMRRRLRRQQVDESQNEGGLDQ